MIPTWLYSLAIKIADKYEEEERLRSEKDYANLSEDEFNDLLNAGEDDRGNPIF
jgi:hypothetical protein